MKKNKENRKILQQVKYAIIRIVKLMILPLFCLSWCVAMQFNDMGKLCLLKVMQLDEIFWNNLAITDIISSLSFLP